MFKRFSASALRFASGVTQYVPLFETYSSFGGSIPGTVVVAIDWIPSPASELGAPCQKFNPMTVASATLAASV